MKLFHRIFSNATTHTENTMKIKVSMPSDSKMHQMPINLADIINVERLTFSSSVENLIHNSIDRPAKFGQGKCEKFS